MSPKRIGHLCILLDAKSEGGAAGPTCMSFRNTASHQIRKKLVRWYGRDKDAAGNDGRSIGLVMSISFPKINGQVVPPS